jgi:hypothetical protein
MGQVVSFKKPSRRAITRQANAQGQLLDSMAAEMDAMRRAIAMLIKSVGSNLTPGRYSIIVPVSDEVMPKPGDEVAVEPAEDGATITYVVQEVKEEV